MIWYAISVLKFDLISFPHFEEVGSPHVSLRRGFALAGSISIIIGLVVLLGRTTEVRAQKLPSWAEPRQQTEQRTLNRENFERQRRNDARESRRGRGGIESSDLGRPVGGVEPMAKSCTRNSECNGDKGVCCFGVCASSCNTGECEQDSDCTGPGNQVCCSGTCLKKNQCDQSNVPIGGPWAPLWTGMLILVGLTYGTYRLLDENQFREFSLDAVLFWTKTLALAGMTVGALSALSGDLFVEASACSSAVSAVIPWSLYWGGMVAVGGLLVLGSWLGFGNMKDVLE